MNTILEDRNLKMEKYWCKQMIKTKFIKKQKQAKVCFLCDVIVCIFVVIVMLFVTKEMIIGKIKCLS